MAVLSLIFYHLPRRESRKRLAHFRRPARFYVADLCPIISYQPYIIVICPVFFDRFIPKPFYKIAVFLRFPESNKGFLRAAGKLCMNRINQAEIHTIRRSKDDDYNNGPKQSVLISPNESNAIPLGNTILSPAIRPFVVMRM